MDNIFLASALSMFGLGLTFSIILALAHKALHVEVDQKVADIERVLPGINCGACGAASCFDFAEKVVRGSCKPNGCIVGGKETGEKIAGILGVKASAFEKKIAVIHCGAIGDDCADRAEYCGAPTCVACQSVMNGNIACTFGCLGLGDCKLACPFDAIIIERGQVIILPDKCTACGSCVGACPRQLITIEPYTTGGLTTVVCNSTAVGAHVRVVCKVGCIGCGICAKMSPNGEFVINDNLSRVDFDKADEKTPWSDLMMKCPTSSIVHVIQLSSGAVSWVAKNRKEVFNE